MNYLGSLSIELLGPLRVQYADRGAPVALPKRRRSLLGLLALRPGAVVTVEQLVDGLWGEDAPDTAVRTLHAHIAKLSASIGSGAGRLIRRQDPGYLLAADSIGIDARRFEELAVRGLRYIERGRFAEAAQLYETALALWRGDVLADCTVHGWAASDAAALEDLRLDAEEGRYAAALAAGAAAGGLAVPVGDVERMVARHPLRERRWALLMAALQAGGRTSDALAAYRRARNTLIAELAVEPGEGLRHAEAAILRGVADPGTLLRLPPAVISGGSTTGSPALPVTLTPLIGRAGDINAVSALLGHGRLVTLTGFGGSGKTRLAIEVAGAAAENFDEVRFVDLATLQHPEIVTQAIADALGVRELPGESLFDLLVARISADPILLVLDNCEHVVEECARVAHELLVRCPGLRILATSQESLRVPGEIVELVQELPLPDPASVRGAAELRGFDAVTLFADRARISIAELSPRDARAVAAICARCEGLPLAIELAAARARMLSLPEIARRLHDRFEVLSEGPRTVRLHHRALRATVEWSFGLLTGEERAALCRFGLFTGNFDLPAAQAVCRGAPVLDLLGRLADKSLVKLIATPAGTRYRLLETIRAYVAERFAERPAERARAVGDHARYFLAQAEEFERRLQGPDLGPYMEQTTGYLDDLRAALLWLKDEDPEAALRMAASSWRYHYLSGHYREGRACLMAALDIGDAKVDQKVLAKACWAAAKLAALECDYDEALALATRSLQTSWDFVTAARAKAVLGAIARERGDYRRALDFGQASLSAAQATGDRWTAAHAMQLLGFACWLSGDYPAATRWSGQAYRLLGRIGDRERLAWCLVDLGAVAFYEGKTKEAIPRLRQALTWFHEVRFQEGIAWAENLLALVDLELARPADAVRRLAVSLRLHTELGDRWRQASVLDALARCAVELGDSPMSAELLAAADTIRDTIGTPVPTCERAAWQATRAELGEEAVAAARRAGSLGIDQILQRLPALLSFDSAAT